jgi:hypothetical protein
LVNEDGGSNILPIKRDKIKKSLIGNKRQRRKDSENELEVEEEIDNKKVYIY